METRRNAPNLAECDRQVRPASATECAPSRSCATLLKQPRQASPPTRHAARRDPKASHVV
eukprot:CAMPEP_0172551848 /NCGR_PEP_ID=MMETSP1067-20121228/41525_1 /TAXON_ID=265564 ORGANISM="Thalassiosira punctigera, Strain Tpunct2005C2" /NCGR_SAMPLE_ID=MMETSP1067 /ASSEMBLY_ACC=CAM_ASM_000444 /LENGTH=59 /DNA_ID=CAMNT_0013339695 /DNA_START=116 /DNA_END=292 /DNA_ORIENTATION=-